MGSIQAQAEPTGSRECKKLHLLDSIDETVKSELRLLNWRTVMVIKHKRQKRSCLSYNHDLL